MTDKAETQYADLPSNPAFNQWCFTTQDERVLLGGKPVPLLTSLLYRTCGNNQAKFAEVLRALQLAFEAGQRAAPKVSAEADMPDEPGCDHYWVVDGQIARCDREGCDYVRKPQGDEHTELLTGEPS